MTGGRTRLAKKESNPFVTSSRHTARPIQTNTDRWDANYSINVRNPRGIRSRYASNLLDDWYPDGLVSRAENRLETYSR